ncbi:hypothetical protein H6776_00450 [Candidatus Nomurabacteria bacterium]|nr:hypothetical protein [Candidatus Nomurabacteria bacterium]
MKKTSHETLVLLDAHAIIHRAYHALPDFSNADGEPTGALFGLITMLLGVVKEFKPDYIAAAYDLPGKTFRHEAYADYKGGRKETEDALKHQLQSSRGVCEAFNIPIFDAPGFEADDMVGTIVEQVISHKEYQDIDIVIATGDMDLMQLITGDRVRVFTLRKGIKDTIIYNEQAVMDRFGFGPELLTDYKGLRGDTSDNIIGIKGIGEKTATQLLVLYGSLENLYEHIHTNRQQLIDDGVKERIVKLLEEHEAEALFSKGLATIRLDAPITYSFPSDTWIDSLNKDRLLEMCRRYQFRSLVPRIEGLFAESTQGAGAAADGQSEEAASAQPADALSPDTARRLGVMLWVMNPETTHPTAEEVFEHMGVTTAEEAEKALVKKLTEMNLLKVFTKIEEPLLPLMKKIQETGVMIDRKVLSDLAQEYSKTLEKLEQKIHTHAGHEFNVRSTQQLSEVLFEELGLPTKGVKKTKAGGYSTKESILEKLYDEHAIIKDLLEYRELHKLVSTYLEPLADHIGDDGRLHSELLQDGTVTGRFASQNPNLQNIPIRSEQGRVIRKAFIAAPGYSLVACDYSQIELRIAAMLSQDEYMTRVFNEGGDIHAAVAARVFGVNPEDIDYEQRRRAKIINFGMLYGMGVTALQKQLGTDRKEAQSFYNAYFEQFPAITKYLEDTKEFARTHGYTETMFGRKRFFSNITSKLPFIRAMAERMAINAPIQGTEADLIKLVMHQIDQWITKHKLETEVKMVMQVHDEIVFEIKDEKIEEVVPELVKLMQSAFDQDWIDITPALPIKVDYGVGKNWFEVK